MRRFKPILLLALSAITAALVLRCGAENPFEPARGDDEVWIQASSFDPTELTVTSGTTVTWTNKDATGHDVTSGTPNNVTHDFTSSPLTLNQGETHSATFAKKGRFPYFCTRHRTKVGAIVVE
jgi:plastocyanin